MLKPGKPPWGTQMKIKTALLALCVFSVPFLISANLSVDSQTGSVDLAFAFGPSTAHAGDRAEARRVARRTARRTARRVNRRHDYYSSLPTSCTKVFINGDLHHFCDGIYYREAIDKDDTVFVIVNP